MAVDVGEAEVTAFVFVGEFLVFDAEEVKGGGVEVVDVEGVFCRGEAKGIGLAVGDSSFNSTTGHEHGSGLSVVVATGALGHGSATEFTAPDDEGVVEEAALFQILDEGGGALVDILCAGLHTADDISVVVPSAVVELDKTNATLGHAAGHEAVRSEGAIGLVAEAVEIPGGF